MREIKHFQGVHLAKFFGENNSVWLSDEKKVCEWQLYFSPTWMYKSWHVTHTLKQEGKRWNTHCAGYPTVTIPYPLPFAIICLMGNPSPAIRRLLRLVPVETKIHLWSDMDYGGFNILSQLRKQVSARVEPFLMNISTFEKHAALSRPLTQSDIRNLKRLALNPNLRDVQLVIEYLLRRGLKLEQEAVEQVQLITIASNI
jgi:hypothetical protein